MPDMKASGSETERLIDVINIKTEVMEAEDDQPSITEGKGGHEDDDQSENGDLQNGRNNAENLQKDGIKKFTCVTCHRVFDTDEELVNHFQFECDSASTILSAAPGAFPSLIPKPDLKPSSTITRSASSDVSNPQHVSTKVQEKPKMVHSKNDSSKPSITDMSGKLQAPILLPLTVHTEDPFSIRILGPPQVIIPVAIGRKTDLLVSSISVDQSIAGNIAIPPNLPLSNGIPNFAIPINSVSTSTSSNPQPPPIKRPKLSIEVGPLDLSLKMLKPKPAVPMIPPNFLSLASSLAAQIPTTSLASSKLPIPVTEERPFKCNCGVEFSSEKVYKGHKNFYCPLRPQTEEEAPKQPVQKFPDQCAHCDFRPSSSSNLSQHVREHHASVKGYICALCGYRGLSLRGIRGHLRVHIPTLSMVGNENDAIFRKYVLEDRGTNTIVSCSQCHQAFLTQETMATHNCSKKS